MAGYNTKSCNALQKPYYRPIEVAIRWCGLVEYEAEILAELDRAGLIVPVAGQFPKWPCLGVNTEKIFDAIAHGEIPCGRDGRTVDDHVAAHRRTVRHTDLRVWMAKYSPDQKPEFLFDETERSTHAAINADSFKALQVDLMAEKARYMAGERRHEKTIELLKAATEKVYSLENERNAMTAMVARSDIGSKERGTWLKIIYLLAVKVADTNPTAYKKNNDSFNLSQFELLLKDLAKEHWPQDNGSTAPPGHGLSDANFKIIIDEVKKLF